MKKLLTLLTLLTVFYISNAQYVVPRGLPFSDTRGWINYKAPGGFVLFDSLTMFRSMGDTLMKPLYPALGYIHDFDGDSTFWIWDMVRWKKFSSGGGSGGDSLGYNTVSQLTDSSFTINRFDGTTDTVEFVTDTTCGAVTGDSVTLNAGTNITIDGDATQAISDNPIWTINSVATQWKAPFSSSFGVAGGVTLSSTFYFQTTGRASGFITDESTVQFVVSEDATANNLFVRTTGTQPASGTMVFTLRVNGASTALTLTIPAGSSTGTYSDAIHTVSLTAGDLIDWQVVNNATSTGVTILSIGASLTGSF